MWFLPVHLRESIPVAPHLGAFGVVRKNHTHEGVDLYVPNGDPVFAVEPGIVVAILPFTGEHCGSPWWHDTWCVMVEGASGVVNYGEIVPRPGLDIGDEVRPIDVVGHVKTVLKKDKGRPMSMLHIELYEAGVREPVEWLPDAPRPAGLLDPTSFLLDSYGYEDE